MLGYPLLLGPLVAAGLALAEPEAPAGPRTVTPSPRPLILTVGQSVRLQMSSKKPIRSVVNEKEGVARVQATDDPTVVLVTGLTPGSTRITLTARDGSRETRAVGQPAAKQP